MPARQLGDLMEKPQDSFVVCMHRKIVILKKQKKNTSALKKIALSRLSLALSTSMYQTFSDMHVLNVLHQKSYYRGFLLKKMPDFDKSSLS